LLWYFSGRSLWERARKSLVFLVVMATLWGACYATFLSVKPADGSVWMPRYLAFIWPAAALGLSALLMRLPTRPLRWAAIGVVIAVNLGQIYGRVFLGNEPPLDRAVADVLADTNDPATLTFTPSLRTARNDDRLTVRYLGGAP